MFEMGTQSAAVKAHLSIFLVRTAHQGFLETPVIHIDLTRAPAGTPR